MHRETCWGQVLSYLNNRKSWERSEGYKSHSLLGEHRCNLLNRGKNRENTLPKMKASHRRNRGILQVIGADVSSIISPLIKAARLEHSIVESFAYLYLRVPKLHMKRKNDIQK